MAKLQLKPAGHHRTCTVEIRRALSGGSGVLDVTVDNETIRVELTEAATAQWFMIRGRIVPFHAVRSGEHVHVWVGGETYLFEVVQPTARRTVKTETVTPADAELTAAMPGTVLKVLVKPGDVIAANQPVIVLESMKMEMTLCAPFDGTVEKITCKPGEMVELGRVLARFKQADREADDS